MPGSIKFFKKKKAAVPAGGVFTQKGPGTVNLTTKQFSCTDGFSRYLEVNIKSLTSTVVLQLKSTSSASWVYWQSKKLGSVFKGYKWIKSSAMVNQSIEDCAKMFVPGDTVMLKLFASPDLTSAFIWAGINGVWFDDVVAGVLGSEGDWSGNAYLSFLGNTVTDEIETVVNPALWKYPLPAGSVGYPY